MTPIIVINFLKEKYALPYVLLCLNKDNIRNVRHALDTGISCVLID